MNEGGTLLQQAVHRFEAEQQRIALAIEVADVEFLRACGIDPSYVPAPEDTERISLKWVRL